MAQQELRSVITIGATVDNSFTKIGGTLMNLGSEIDKFSRKIIEFGKESIQEFVEYDDLMREVQAVGEFTNAEIDALERLNSEIAKTSTYTNRQAAEAEVFLGQLGLTTTEIATILPSVLEMAMSGNLSLSDSANYLYSTLRSLGYELEYADTLTDQMAKTSAIGATDIDTLGDSLTRIGSGLQLFEGGSTEVLAILSAMSDFGEDQRGSQGGTWLRNFMLALAAPAGSIGDLVDAMEQLGVAQEEIEEYAESHGSGAAAMAVESLTEAGLRIYDEKGGLLPAIEIIKSLRNAVRGSDQYADDLTEMTGALDQAGGDIEAFMAQTEGMTDNALYNVFAKIFGKRGITTALNLISVSDEDWARLVSEITNSEGFAESMVDTMQGGLGGALRSLEASASDLKTTLVGVAETDLQKTAEWIEGIVEDISELDDDTLSKLVSGLMGVAAAGPGMLAVGGAMRLIGYLLTPAGAISAGVVALAALAYHMHQVREADFTENFGTMEIDTQSLLEHVDGLSTSFSNNMDELTPWTKAVDEATASYAKFAEGFSQELLMGTLTGRELTEDEQSALQTYGENMISAVLTGIENKEAQQLSLLALLFGDSETEAEALAFENLVDWENAYFGDLYAEAEGIGAELRSKLTEALQDNTLDEGERTAIQSTVDRLNQINAEISNRMEKGEYYAELNKAQRVSWDSIEEFLSENGEKLQDELSAFDDTWDEKLGYSQAAYEAKRADATTDEERNLIDAQWRNAKAQLERERAEQREEVIARRSEIGQTAYDAMMHDSDFGDAWNLLEQAFADQTLRDETGEIDFSRMDFKKYFPNGVPEGLSDQLLDLSMTDTGPGGWWHGLGTGKMTAALAPYAENEGMAQRIQMLEKAYGLMVEISGYEERSNRYKETGIDHLGEFADQTITYDADTTLAEEQIAALNGTDITVDAMTDPSDIQSQLDSRQYQVQVRGNVKPLVGGPPMTGFADGGRATEASIFGEAGAEWAIPEAHTDRTADLLNAARAASGFTWPELLSRYGGLNANPAHIPTTLVYAPVIHAANADGVEQKLLEDKKRLDAWWEEKQLREERVTY